MPKPDPHPPSAADASRILAEASKDPDWGLFIWLAMVTGARRGELCALRWDRFDASAGVLEIRSSLDQHNAEMVEKATKTHQKRRIALDKQTVAMLAAQHMVCVARAADFSVELPPDARMFSLSPDGSTWFRPDTVTQRYARMCAKLGIETHFHQLRHYSATELIAAGVDVRTVAGRLGHAGGGTTTLRVYSAWRAEADQRAVLALANRLVSPADTVAADSTTDLPKADRGSDPAIVTDLRGAISCGAWAPGSMLPAPSEIAARYEVPERTVDRCLEILAGEGLIALAVSGRAIVLRS